MKTLSRAVPILFLFSFLVALPAAGQERIITGVVTAAETGQPIAGASVLVRGTTRGTITGQNGRYQIAASPGATLVVRMIGYRSAEVSVGDRSTVDVALAVEATHLDEVVAIGYGEQSRATLTTSISKLDTTTLRNVVHANPSSALQGTIPGLRVQTTSGQPGAAPRVILRGGTSINNPNGATPLYIVDGVIRGNIADLNPLDIESMQVLKDAAATAIYGARASNGVIIVTTRTGRPGQAQITYSSSLQVSEMPRRMPLVSARDYIHYGRLAVAATGELDPGRLAMLNQAFGFGTGNDLSNRTAYTTQFLTPQNEHKLHEGWQSMPDPLDPSRTIIFQETDWQSVLFQRGRTQNHYVSVAGGSDVASYNFGLGYLDNEGIAITTGYQRLTLDMGGNVQVRSNLRLGGGLNFSNASDNRVFSDFEIFQRAMGLPPTAKLRFEDGTLAPGQNRSIGNPLYHLDRSRSRNSFDRFSMRLNGRLDIAPGVYFEPSASLYTTRGVDNFFQMSYWNTPTQFIDSRNASASHSLFWQRQGDGVLTLERTLGGAHNLEAKVGTSYYDRKSYALSAAGRGGASDLIPTLNAASEATSVSSTASDQVIAGGFTRVNYNYDGKYLLALTGRYDGASNLGFNNQWGFFPGVSAGWNLHREPFWRSVPDVLSSLKLRGSYGVSGNVTGLSDFHAQGEYTVGSRYAGQAAVLNNRMANQDLRWERSATSGVGLDIGFFNDRTTLLVDVYRRVTDDLLTSLELPHSTGFLSILTNLGALENRGFEVEAVSDILRNPQGLNWTLRLNAATNRNQILRLPDNGNERNRIGGTQVYDPSVGDYVWVGGLQEGRRMGDLYIWQQLGVYATDEEAAAGPLDNLVPRTNKRKRAGDVILADLDGNGVIDHRDQVYVGNIFPTWTGGFANDLRYRNLGLTVRADYATGHTIFNQSLVAYNGQTQGDIVFTTEVLRSWQQPGDRTDVPRYYWADQLAQNNIFRENRGTSYYYEKGDYLALREVTLSYTVPNRWSGWFGMSNARLYVTGNNLHYFTGYKGLMPEDGGTDNGRYPNPRNLLVGVNVGL
jgi:TonB-linked SusC/RagA family outer membrane protein